MKLHYYKPTDDSTNFGDELNKYIWDSYFPGFFNKNTAEVFFGIGTILRAAKKYYPSSEIIIFGSGAHSKIQKKEENFNVHFVRGPLTAKALGIEKKWITDPAILTPEVFPCTKKSLFKYSYMPHFSVDNSAYKIAVEKLGIQYVSPKLPVDKVIKCLNNSDILITEAMHGAIVADAYRIPWIPVKTYHSFNFFKWTDWAKSMQLEINITELPRLYSSDNKLKRYIKGKIFIEKLKKTCKLKPYLSEDDVLSDNKKKIEQEIIIFKNKYNL